MLGCIRGGNKTETGLQYFCKDMREKKEVLEADFLGWVTGWIYEVGGPHVSWLLWVKTEGIWK